MDQDDIDEIVESHLKNGKVVERLLTPPHLGAEAMNLQTRRFQLAGPPATSKSCAMSRPGSRRRGIAVIAHPHPLFGGTMDNKVVQTMARAFVQAGWVALRAIR